MRCEQVVYLASDGGMQSARGSRDGLIDRFVRGGRLKVPVLVEVAAKELKQIRVLITGPHNASIAPPPLSSAFAWRQQRGRPACPTSSRPGPAGRDAMCRNATSPSEAGWLGGLHASWRRQEQTCPASTIRRRAVRNG